MAVHLEIDMSFTIIMILYVVQLVLWPWRLRSFLWWRETLWLYTAITRPLLPTSQLPSIKMAFSSRTSLQETWPSNVFQSLMKDCTSVTSLELENHQRAGWLLEVRHKLYLIKINFEGLNKGTVTWFKGEIMALTNVKRIQDIKQLHQVIRLNYATINIPIPCYILHAITSIKKSMTN